MWFSDKPAGPVSYESTEEHEAECMPGVRYVVRKPSLKRRAEITKRVRALLGELEYRQAGEGLAERLAAAELESGIDRVYLEWGLVKVENLLVDGEACGVAALVERGPEALAREIAAAVRRQCSLSEAERKN